MSSEGYIPTADAGGFDALLRALASDRNAAAAAYRQLHARLMRFFRMHPVDDPESLADTALDRLARRIGDLAQGPEGVPSLGNITGFALGIARHILQEEGRRRRREGELGLAWVQTDFGPDERQERMLGALEGCLAKMRVDQRQLVEGYYKSTGKEKIDHHKELADQLGIKINALRNRLMRARQDLDKCIRENARDVFPSEDSTVRGPGTRRRGEPN